MAFEFIGNALSNVSDVFRGIGAEVGNGRTNRADDVTGVKRAFAALGRMEEPEDEPDGFIDRALDTAIHGFRRDKGLRVDGFMLPGGPTERSLQDDLQGLLSQQKGALGSLGRGQGRSGSFGSGGRFDPALTLRGADRDASLDEGGTSFLGFDGPPSDRDRAPHGRAGGSFSLLDLGFGRGGAHSPELRPERHQAALRSSGLGAEDRGARSPALPTAAAERPSEPPGLKPFLDKLERNYRRTADGWRKEGMTDAARHLEHFLDGSGEPIIYNRGQARSFGPVRNAEQNAQAVIREQILQKARELEDGESFTGKLEPEERGEHGLISHGLDLLRGLLGDGDHLNDNLATGRTRVRPIFEGTISRDGNKIVVDGAVQYDWNDRYDFHPWQPGAAAAGLERYRGAKPFEFGGTWRQSLKGSVERRRERLLPDLSFSDVDE